MVMILSVFIGNHNELEKIPRKYQCPTKKTVIIATSDYKIAYIMLSGPYDYR